MADITKNQKALMLLNSNGISLKRKNKFLELATEPKEIFENFADMLADIAIAIGTDNAER
jgi:hypothetical protein